MRWVRKEDVASERLELLEAWYREIVPALLDNEMLGKRQALATTLGKESKGVLRARN